MKNHGFRFLVILVIAALCVWVTIDKKVRLGLDLAGGSSLTYGVKAEEGVSKDKLDRAIEVITKRVNATGLTEIYIAQTATGEIVVEMPKRSDTEIQSVKSLIERNGQLEFRIRADLTVEAAEREKKAQTPPNLYHEPPGMRWVPNNPKEASEQTLDEILVKTPEVPFQQAYEALKAKRGEKDKETIEAQQKYEDARLSEVFRGEDLASTHLTMDGAQIVVAFEFKDARKNDFKEFTSANIKKPMAIILDGQVSSAPIINGVLPGSGIITGGGSRGFTEAEANDLRIVLESGSTGVQLSLEREETLGASLGNVAIERGKWSVIVGFLAVVLLMLWYYRLPGLIADLALLLNVVIILGAMAFFRGALSLPGIAGIVLTLGMAVDANVLIFERLRDERRRGKTLQESLAAGYDNAMSAIIDGNVTTLLTAFVLIAMGTGAVKGFGVTLTIGLLASMFTAIWVTRVVFEFLIDRGLLKSFDIGKDPKEPTWDYMKGRRFLTVPSLVLMAAGTIGFLAREETASKDLEFIGGQQVIVQLTTAVSSARINEIAKGPGNRWEDANPVMLEPEGVDAAPDTSNRWQIRVKAEDEDKGAEYVAYLRSALADVFVADPYTGWTEIPAKDGQPARTSFVVHTLAPLTQVAAFKQALEAQKLGHVEVGDAEGGDARVRRVTVDALAGGEPVVKERVRNALATIPGVNLSDPTPSVSYLSSAQAEHLWRIALEAMFASLVIQIIYIRIRFADYAHGFAAVLALVHDVTITLGAVALFDSQEWIYAKVNLVLIAAFLTLIGYSMNDTIVVFDRIRENLGRSKVIRSRIVNESLNQTFARSLRTSMTVFVTVVVQFFFNRNLGSSIEGFAFVMIVGSIAGAYSSMFIAAPLLLFLPGYGRKLTSNRTVFVGLCTATVAGSLLAVTTRGHGPTMWTGIAIASVVPIHFLVHFVPWLEHADPDELVIEESAGVEDEPPLTNPGV